ncbi:unnamed protein product [Musa textilis]
MTNYALMALNNEIYDSTKTLLPCNKLLSDFHDLYDEIKLVGKRYKLLKEDNAFLSHEFEKFKNEYDKCLLMPCTKCEELESFKKKNILLQEILENFKIDNNSLNMILTHKSHVRRKEGISSMSSTQQMSTIFVKEPTLHVSLRLSVIFVINMVIMFINVYLKNMTSIN